MCNGTLIVGAENFCRSPAHAARRCRWRAPDENAQQSPDGLWKAHDQTKATSATAMSFAAGIATVPRTPSEDASGQMPRDPRPRPNDDDDRKPLSTNAQVSSFTPHGEYRMGHLRNTLDIARDLDSFIRGGGVAHRNSSINNNVA